MGVVETLSASGYADLTLTTSPSTPAGALLVAVQGCDFYDAADLVSPTPGVWALKAGDGNLSSGHPHAKVWTQTAVAGANAVVFHEARDSGNHARLYVVTGVTGVANGAGSFGGSTVSHSCPSVVALGANDVLINDAIGLTNGVASFDYVAPAGVVESDVATWSTMGSHAETLAAAGATGTRVLTASTACEYASVSIAVEMAAGPSGSAGSTVTLATSTAGTKWVDAVTGGSMALATAVVGSKSAASVRTSPLTLGGAAIGGSIRGSARTSTLTLASSSTGGPVTGSIPAVVSPVLCAPWATPADVPATIRTELGLTDDQLAVQLMRASELLWMLTGRIWYGIGCSEEVTLRSLPTSAPWRGDWITHSSWGECPCWLTSGSVVDHIAQPLRVKLPRSPVQAITSVTVEGVVLAPTAYRLNHAGVLERIDGGLWQVCTGETVIVYTYGEAPPAGGRDAAVTLGVEFARDLHGLGNCRLPSNVTSLTRQEVTTTYADPNEFLEKGLTGLRSVDLWVKAVNPHNRPQRARVYSPDVPRTNRRSLP